jgi:protocatechuate 3,4-dioxygenase, beta subunit
MSDRERLSRRDVLRRCGMGSLLCAAGRSSPAAQTTRRTPTQVLGPFYPVVKPLDQDADLTVVAGRPGRAAGQVVEVMGRIMNREGQPVPGARVEIWQANTYGRYTHPSDRNPAPLDPNFEGFAVLKTDAEGRYRFRTIKPGAYPDDSGALRAPHIHFEVLGRTNRLVTQMYFAGEALNDTDRFLATAAGNRARLIVPFLPSAEPNADGSLVGVWDIVLDQG